MPCLRYDNAIVCFNDQHSVKIGSRKYRFELHYFGPFLVDKNGDGVAYDAMTRKFWRKFYAKVKRHPAYIRWRIRADEQIAAEEPRRMTD